MFVQGSVMTEAATKDELWSIFEKGSENRHVASTSKKKTNFDSQCGKNTESQSRANNQSVWNQDWKTRGLHIYFPCFSCKMNLCQAVWVAGFIFVFCHVYLITIYKTNGEYFFFFRDECRELAISSYSWNCYRKYQFNFWRRSERQGESDQFQLLSFA